METRITNEPLNKEIIDVLKEQNGSRMSYIAEKTGRPYNTIRYRVFELERKGIVRIDDSRLHMVKVYIRGDKTV